MNPIELVSMALRTIASSPMRTLLTMLGVIIGVSSVITLVSIGQGTSAQIEKQYESLGTNLLVVNVLGNGRATQLDYNDLMQLEQLPEINSIAPTMVKSGSNIKYDRRQEKYTVVGTNDRYLPLMKGELSAGRFVIDADMEFRNPVAIFGSTVAKDYFGSLDPIGEDINIDGIVFTIVGVLKEKGSSISGVSLDNSVFVPLETARRAFKLGNIRTTYLEAPTKDQLSMTQSTITQYLTYKFKSSSGFQIMNQDELMKARVEAASTLTNQLIAVACISLLVGGIGIMNIMLVTVSERTREIGIRKSIGAKRRNILMQFLIEATVISGLGGIIGLLLGSGLSLAWPMINPKQPTQLSLEVGLYAFLFSVGVGMIFGLYPANKASKLRPIDALRSD
ncbi:ABC transporter permease [Paenibacillus radicis (ex Xue et al. 2023)]|uniref:ABC transporter permease n=1 Tax=Paenibacillus radicis (ex Xue et al. 2023) TaxID=2972489 RepID=A0ABT1YJA1_9BACL|nr:ABC transporter permease [Paenibacillus radicis (ex Xue et al. 2023)]MCR8633266.1 ABC transporter permease [Paenibacillus radicis (ex Xue et al. 2023)]